MSIESIYCHIKHTKIKMKMGFMKKKKKTR